MFDVQFETWCARRLKLVVAAAAALAALGAQPAAALPSFSTQTGEECAACHVGGFGPQLTQHGRMFKLQGYGATQSWQSKKTFDLPLAAMAVVNYVRTSKDQSAPPANHFQTNDNVALQEASLFVAGRIAPGFGAFVQGTYSGVDRKASLDNVDLRYAREVKIAGQESVIGVSVNNNPTVQDVWNSTPAWGFPYTSPDLAPGRSGSPLISDGLGGQVLGATAYGLFGDHLYAEFGGYKSLSRNTLDLFNLSQDAVVSGTAPYWRVAYTQSKGGRSASIGLFGLDAKLQPDPTAPETDHYSDVGIDATYQMMLPKKASLSFNGAYIRERRTLDASVAAGAATNRKGDVDSLTADAAYYWDKKYGLTLGLFHTTGSVDDSLYAPEADAGSRTGKPNSDGFTLQADYTPFGQEGSWGAPYANLRLGAQFTGYSKFNGAGSNYDGFGRDAKDNNTLSLFLWTAF